MRSLASITSTTGNTEVGRPTEAALALLAVPPVPTRDGVMDRAVVASRTVGSPAYPADEAGVRARPRASSTGRSIRSVRPQMAASIVQPDRTADLGRLSVPTLVIHGAEDPLIQVSGGQAKAAAIPGAELVVIHGIGHDLPPALWAEIADHIPGLVRRAEAGAGSKRG